MIINADDIVSSMDLVELISKYVDLRKEGSSYSGRSPFTSGDSDPSFKVNQRKGIYKCFSTGIGGNNAASFLMHKDGMTYPEALEKIAAMTGTVVQYSSGATREQDVKAAKDKRDNESKMYAAIERAHAFLIENGKLKIENESQLQTATSIAGKSYTPEMISKWELIVTGDSHALDNASASWPERPQLIEMGMLAESKNSYPSPTFNSPQPSLKKEGVSGYYDFFHSRLLFPIRGKGGQLIGYNGRALSWVKGDKHPKYINSKDSLIYDKSKAVYGYAQNWREIARLKIALLVEGPTDVIMLDQAGIGHAVAASGTALSIDQAKLIAQSADTIIIMYDGDDAGQKRTAAAVEVCLMAQLEVKVRTIPNGMDPSEYIDTIEGTKHEAIMELPAVDGIECVINREYPNVVDASPNAQTGALMRARHLIACIGDKDERKMYARSISKVLGVTTTVVNTAVSDYIKERDERKNRLTSEQEVHKTLYGVYRDHNQYRDHNGVELSTFVIMPLFLVSYQDTAYRIFEIMNKFGHQKVININSDDFITLMGFRRATEKLGSFIFKGNEAQFTKIREWVYNEMKEVKPIEVLGYQPRSGIYAWANGITLPGTSKVMEVDEYGVVDHTDDANVTTSYFLPSGTKILPINTDDVDNEIEKNFRYRIPPSGSGAPTSLSEWAHGFAKVFGENAIMGLCWTLSIVHRDMLHRRYDMFPHLNTFGPAGSGKTFMTQVIASVFGKPLRAIHMVSSTDVAFYRVMSQVRNALVRFEELSEKVDGKRIEAVKNAADGFGRTTGQMTNNNKTKVLPVYSAISISGQVLPSFDPAVLSRCITLYFDRYKELDKRKSLYGERFKAWGSSGYFAYVAAEIFSYRELIESKFDDVMEEVRDHLRSMFVSSNMPDDRVLNNYSMVVTVYRIIAKVISMPYKDAEVFDNAYTRIVSQCSAVEGADELSGWWMVIEYLITKDKEMKGHGLGLDHYCVEMHRSVKTKDGSIMEWDVEQKLLFLKLNYAHSMYTREGRNMVSRVVEKGTLLHYMRQHRSYVGEMVKWFAHSGASNRCYVFNLNEMPNMELDVTYAEPKRSEKVETADIFKQNTDNMEFNDPNKGGESPF